ncbi:MAG: DeoR family transcriptional regulator, partial [Candidatus Brennerbacteria bacterium]|nr:DeoR family transcriptional regulator [Candidatus Brennerbacteria bacterium]
MNPSPFKDFIKEKSFDIVFAVFRVAALIKNSRIKEKLENSGLKLLLERTSGALEELEYLVRLGEGLNEIKNIDSKVLYREFGNLNSAIRQSANGNAEIEKIFIKQPVLVEKHYSNISQIEVVNGNANLNGNPNGNGNIVNSAIRQTAILEKIRQLPDCRMKDLVVAFSEVSERTLRNDIQRLCDAGMIERIGNGGPASYYIIKNNAENHVIPSSNNLVTQ